LKIELKYGKASKVNMSILFSISEEHTFENNVEPEFVVVIP